MKDFEEVVVAVDGSDASIRAARVALRLARDLDAPLVLLHVFPMMSDDIAGALGLSEEELLEIRDRSARQAFSDVRKELGEAEVEIREEARIGDVGEEIIDYLGDAPDRMLVMGRRGQNAMSALLLGSVSDKVIRHSRSPVTVVG
ncbi:universal stress protein [Wenzhouxiangella marina]|nr:universal stress protein [Wenzhouxiangella marina]MBB6087600.1 nucleotide-binding universal stress UspA family protein [Wenzhouxiangella marina]